MSCWKVKMAYLTQWTTLALVISLSAASCVYNGTEHKEDEQFKSLDGCNTCHCHNSLVVCTKMFCLPKDDVTSCMYYGTVYEDGAQFPASDGCNTCYCSHAQVGCTKMMCFSIDGVGRRDTKVSEEVIPQLWDNV